MNEAVTQQSRPSQTTSAWEWPGSPPAETPLPANRAAARVNGLCLCVLVTGLLAIMSIRIGTASAASLLEVTEKGKKHLGKLEAKGSDICWLMGRDGQLSEFEIDRIQSIRTVSPRFRELSFAELRDQLRRELPKNYRIDGTPHFLVCAEKNSRQFGEICEETYRTFHRYFSVRGFKIAEPEFPLVTIIFPDRSAFGEYCRKDGINPPQGMLGYYMRLTNRTALFNPRERGSASTESGSGKTFASILRQSDEDRLGPFSSERWARDSSRIDAVVEADLHGTIVHETTHQVAFNTGLHSRIGDTPKWVVEGLATMFEAPGIRDSQKGSSAKSRVNRERLAWFMNYLKTRRQPHSLDAFIATDDLYKSATLDAYAEGWALTFFLAETRHGSYVRFLKGIAGRSALTQYRAAERRADFRKAFGDTKSLETDFLRFYANLK